MKRLISIISALAVVLSVCAATLNANAYSNNATISVGETITASINSNGATEADRRYVIELVPDKTDMYELCIRSEAELPANAYINAVIYQKFSNSYCQVGGMAYYNTTSQQDRRGKPDTNEIAAARLEAGTRYYFIISGDNYRSATLSVTLSRGHICQNTYRYVVQADYCYSYDEANGGLYEHCVSCNSNRVIEKYYAIKGVKLSCKEYVYDGKPKRPRATAYDVRDSIIPAEFCKTKYYNYRSKENGKPTSVGFAYAEVSFSGERYSSQIRLVQRYVIIPKGTTLTKPATAKKSITLKWKKQTVQTSGYQIKYSDNKNFKNAKTIIVSGSKSTSKKIAGLKRGKKYYVKIRTYKAIDDYDAYGNQRKTKIYSHWSDAKKIATKK